MTTRQRIAKAVADEEWQAFRRSLKGKTTREKLERLKEYYINEHDSFSQLLFFDMSYHTEQWLGCDVCVRVDNYIKALCRGGQLYPGESLKTALSQTWNLDIKK